MTDWKTYYKEHLMTAEEAVTHIKSGDIVINAHLGGAPQPIIDAMVKNHAAYKDVTIRCLLTSDGLPYADEKYKDNFHLNTWFMAKPSAKALAEGYADFAPSHFSEIPYLIDQMERVDVALVQASEPDENGYVSMGLTSDYTYAAAKKAKKVICEINKQCPRLNGDTMLHVTELECIVETDRPVAAAPVTKITDVERAIGNYCAQLIHDGDVLQMGLGAIPDAVLGFLEDKKDLGIHSEIIGDGVKHLCELGVITGARKQIHPGKVIATSLYGTKELMDYVNNNPMFELYSVDYVNDPRVISQNDHMVSINSCVEVDLTGQVCSEAVGARQISGIGGQVDFVRGAKMSKGGKSIIACYSTAKGGTISKIVAALKPGTPVTTSRTDVDYVVTEYGIAHLRGATLRERAEALINIAHPDFREELRSQYKQIYGLPL